MKAELLIRGNAIFDSVSDLPFAGFVATSGNRIIGVGRDADAGMDAYVDEKTKVIDAKDRLVMPGFHDSHTHLLLAGMYKSCVNLASARSEEEAAQMAYDYEKEHPSEGWVYGFSWYQVFWDKKDLPTKASLDRYFPDRPVFLVNAEAHGAWVNTKALEIAGITKETEDPYGGCIERLADGEPSGFLEETAVAFVSRHCLRFDPKREKQFLKTYMESAAPFGITSIVDVQPYFGTNMGNLETYREMEQSGEMTVRVHVASNLFDDMEAAAKEAAACTGDRLRANMAKQFVDGVFVNHTALVLDDYADAPGNKGYELSALSAIEEGILRAHQHEISVKIHALGDRAVRFTLDCFEKAQKTYGKNKARHAIEHIELVAEEDIPRFRELGIIPSMQPEHLGLVPRWEDEEYRTALGEERAATTWRFKTLLDTAGVIAFGSDCPVVDNNPFYGLHRGICRLHDDGLPEGGWNPTEKLTLAELLKGYTIGSAFGVSRESELGTLEEGKLADLLVLSDNLFLCTPDEIRKSSVDITVMDGAIIYQK